MDINVLHAFFYDGRIVVSGKVIYQETVFTNHGGTKMLQLFHGGAELDFHSKFPGDVIHVKWMDAGILDGFAE